MKRQILKILTSIVVAAITIVTLYSANFPLSYARCFKQTCQCLRFNSGDSVVIDKERFAMLLDTLDGFYYNEDIFPYNDYDTIVVLVEKDVPGIFQFNHHTYGYYNAVLLEYAKSRNKELKYIFTSSRSDMTEGLKQRGVHFGLIIAHHQNKTEIQGYRNTSLRDSCNYVVIGNKSNNFLNKQPLEYILDSAKVIYRRGAMAIPLLSERVDNYLKDTLAARFNKTDEYMAMIRENEYNFMVCRSDEAFLYTFNYGSLKRIHSVDESVRSVAVTHWRNRKLHNSFEKWLSEFRSSDRYKDIHAHYHDYNYKDNFISTGYINPVGSISHYDTLFKTKVEGTPYRWELLAAIASVESKFNKSQISRAGAVGLMQVMPANTKRWDITPEMLHEPEISVTCAVKLMEENRRMLKIEEDELNIDNLSIMLATYNGGYGHVSDAIRLAKKYKEDYTKWETVRKYLYNKRKPAYYKQTDVVKSGGFRSTETERYVQLVMERYNKYLSLSEKESDNG